jgi:hypothetical protein
MDTERRIPVLVDAAYMYARRLADRFANASRFVLFEHLDSVPRDFKKLRRADRTQLLAWMPRGDVDRLASALAERCAWFDALRGAHGSTNAGIRDTLEHRATWMDVRGRPVAVRIFGYASSDRQQPELFTGLEHIMGGLCSFWTEVCLSIADRSTYNLLDACPGTALDEHGAAFWPDIQVDENLKTS